MTTNYQPKQNQSAKVGKSHTWHSGQPWPDWGGPACIKYREQHTETIVRGRVGGGSKSVCGLWGEIESTLSLGLACDLSSVPFRKGHEQEAAVCCSGGKKICYSVYMTACMCAERTPRSRDRSCGNRSGDLSLMSQIAQSDLFLKVSAARAGGSTFVLRKTK